MERKFWQIISKNAMTLVTILAGIIVIVLTQLEVLSQSLQITMILALLVLLATSNLIETKLDNATVNTKLDRLTDTISKNTENIEIVTFDNNSDLIEYLTKRSLEANFSIDQASVDHRRTSYNETRMKYDKTRDKIIKTNKVKFRYIGMLHNERRLDLARKFIVNSTGLNNFFAAYYKKNELELPLLNFVIFDKKEILTRYPFEYGDDIKYLVIKNQQITNLFLGYFKSLWDGAIKIKSKEDFEKLEKELTTA